jgi:hypothetical protein
MFHLVSANYFSEGHCSFVTHAIVGEFDHSITMQFGKGHLVRF